MGNFGSKCKGVGREDSRLEEEGPQKKSGFYAIQDTFATVEEVQKALRKEGLESSNLIIGMDFTSSNTWTGKQSFGGKSLHYISPHQQNPYQQVISIVGRTLEDFDDDKLIPAFGFGDSFNTDKSAFSFYPDRRPCNGFEEVLTRYTEITPGIELAGPTNFAPVIREAIKIVQEEKAYHILVIIADGQVTVPEDRAGPLRGDSFIDELPEELRAEARQQIQQGGDHQPSCNCHQETVDAIVEASKYALSIVVVGVGDGPWDQMEEFDDELPARKFDNFQFVPFNSVMQKNPPGDARDAGFAVAALMEIPEQFKLIKKLGYLG